MYGLQGIVKYQGEKLTKVKQLFEATNGIIIH